MKKRRWIVRQFRAGRSASSIASIQKISRRMVYKLVQQHKREGDNAFILKKPGRQPLGLNQCFVKTVVDLRKSTDYGSEKLHHVLTRTGFGVSQRQIQRVLDEQGLTSPCLKRRGQRSYVRYEWPISNYMWHTDWSLYKGEWYLIFIDDRSRRIMGAGVFDQATEENATFLLHHTILMQGVCPVIMLSDKGSQFYNNKRNNKGILTPSRFEQELERLGIDLWTSRRNHPQTNGKMEKWFDTMKQRFKRHPEETLKTFVKWYNEERIHHSLSYATPDEVYKQNL